MNHPHCDIFSCHIATCFKTNHTQCDSASDTSSIEPSTTLVVIHISNAQSAPHTRRPSLVLIVHPICIRFLLPQPSLLECRDEWNLDGGLDGGLCVGTGEDVGDGESLPVDRVVTLEADQEVATGGDELVRDLDRR